MYHYFDGVMYMDTGSDDKKNKEIETYISNQDKALKKDKENLEKEIRQAQEKFAQKFCSEWLAKHPTHKPGTEVHLDTEEREKLIDGLMKIANDSLVKCCNNTMLSGYEILDIMKLKVGDKKYFQVDWGYINIRGCTR